MRVPAPGQAQKIAMMGALDFVSRQLTVETSQTKRSADFIALLERLDRIDGQKPGAALKPVTIVLANGPIHASKAARAALAGRKHWLTPEWLARRMRPRETCVAPTPFETLASQAPQGEGKGTAQPFETAS